MRNGNNSECCHGALESSQLFGELLGKKRNPAKLEEETQYWLPGVGAVIVGGKFQKQGLSKMAKKY